MTLNRFMGAAAVLFVVGCDAAEPASEITDPAGSGKSDQVTASGGADDGGDGWR